MTYLYQPLPVVVVIFSFLCPLWMFINFFLYVSHLIYYYRDSFFLSNYINTRQRLIEYISYLFQLAFALKYVKFHILLNYYI